MVDIYKLYRNYWDYAFENPEKISPNHIALYSFIIEHCNRLGWKPKFGLPTSMAMEAIGIKSYNTYSKILNDLIEYGFIELVQKSKNQYSSNIIALSSAYAKNDKALDKALIKHVTKQSESTIQSIDSIIIQIYNIPIYNYTKEQIEKILNYFKEEKIQKVETINGKINNKFSIFTKEEKENQIFLTNQFIDHLELKDQLKDILKDWFKHLTEKGKKLTNAQIETFISNNMNIYDKSKESFAKDIYFTIENGWMTLVRKHLELAGYDPNTGKYIPQCEGDYEP
jgi:hypothetical protein